jgi:hypothetical protein
MTRSYARLEHRAAANAFRMAFSNQLRCAARRRTDFAALVRRRN